MSNDTIQLIVALSFFVIFFLIIILANFIEDKMNNNYQLKKLGIIKPKNKVINLNPDYNEKLKYKIKSWSITIIAILIICVICKLFGFSIKDIVKIVD